MDDGAAVAALRGEGHHALCLAGGQGEGRQGLLVGALHAGGPRKAGEHNGAWREGQR